MKPFFRSKFAAALVVLSLLSCALVPAGVVINEFMASSATTLATATTFEAEFEPVGLVHQWDFESTGDFLAPSQSVGGAASLVVAPGTATEVLRNTPAQDFDSAHLRVNNPLGATLTWALPTTGFEALTLTWETRRSGQGAGTQIVEATIDGQVWTLLDSYPVLDEAPQLRSFDLSGVDGAENNPLLAVRVTFGQGAGGTAGNNRFDNVTLTGMPLPNGSPPASIAFVETPVGTASGSLLEPVAVRLFDSDGNPAVAFNGAVTLSLIGDGQLSGTLTVDAVNGTATFNEVSLTGIGVYQLVANAAGLDPATSAAIRSLAMEALVVPRYIQGDQDGLGENNDRVPFAWLARIDGLLPGATYRFANRVVLASDSPTNDGAGNMIFITSAGENWLRTTSSPRFRPGDHGDRHFTLTAGGDGSFTGWFITEPSGHERFTPGNTVHFRLLLNDGEGGEETSHILTTSQSAQVIRFGTATDEGTAIIGESPTAARRIVVIDDETTGGSRPLAATPVEITGAAVDSRYASFYQNIVATNQSRWGTIIPNNLPNGVRRLEFRASTGKGGILDTRVDAAGLPGTINPAGGQNSPVLLDVDAGLPVFLPGGSATWHDAANWNNGTIPNAAGAQAIVNAPTAGDRNVNINSAAILGSLRVNQGGTDFRNRIRNNHASGTLTFDSGTGGTPATLRVEGAGGSGHADLDFDNPVTLASDLVLLVNQSDGGDLQHGALRLQQSWVGPGGLIKQGPGMVTLSGEGKSFTGPVIIEQGALRITGPAVPASTSGVIVQPGGQLRLVSTGNAEIPRVHTFGGGAIHLGGFGRGGDLPPGQELGVLGALRYDPGTQDNLASLTNPVFLTSIADLHVDGTRNRLRLDGEISGNGHGIVKTGGGVLEFAANSPTAPPVDVETGTLAVTGTHPAAIHLTSGTSLTGHGTVGAVGGPGTVAPGSQSLTAATSSVARLAAVLASPGDAGNGRLVLTDSDNPLPASPLEIEIFLNPATPPVPGDRFRGVLAVPNAFDLEVALAATAVHLRIADPAGETTHLGVAYRVVEPTDHLTWSVAGNTLEILKSGTATTFDQWRGLNFPDPADRADDSISGPDAVDALGMPNLLRYALGLDRDDPDTPHLPRLDADTQTFRFMMDAGKSDLAWLVRASSNLADWSEVLFDSRHAVPPPTDANGLTPILYPTDRNRLFLRLEVLMLD